MLAAAAAVVAVGGCSSDPEPLGELTVPAREPEQARAEQLRQARCPGSLSNCREASGRILYVERVDPDGDGDAHFVLASSDSVTAPGISVIDVRKDLRPSPLPGPGDRLSAAGPVYEGSYGQRQIQAIRVFAGGRD